jgi:hypothetical protein
MSFPRCTRFDRQRMHTLTRQIAEGVVHHSLPHDPADPSKGIAFDLNREVAFARTIIAAMPAVTRAVVGYGEAGWRKSGGQQRFDFRLKGAFCHRHPLSISPDFGQGKIMSAPRNPDRFHGRVRGSQRACAHPQCARPGEFRAPNPYGRASGPNGPGDFQYLCLDHVREFNLGYDWFAGMSADEIAAAQSPLNIWPTESRAFRANGNVDAPPKWADFNDPLEAITARFKGRMDEAVPHMRSDGRILNAEDRKALKTLKLDGDADRKAIRSAYSRLVRRYHPDKNGGDRSHEKALQDVIAAYTHLKMMIDN